MCGTILGHRDGRRENYVSRPSQDFSCCSETDPLSRDLLSGSVQHSVRLLDEAGHVEAEASSMEGIQPPACTATEITNEPLYFV